MLHNRLESNCLFTNLACIVLQKKSTVPVFKHDLQSVAVRKYSTYKYVVCWFIACKGPSELYVYLHQRGLSVCVQNISKNTAQIWREFSYNIQLVLGQET